MTNKDGPSMEGPLLLGSMQWYVKAEVQGEGAGEGDTGKALRTKAAASGAGGKSEKPLFSVVKWAVRWNPQLQGRIEEFLMSLPPKWCKMLRRVMAVFKRKRQRADQGSVAPPS